MLAERIAVDAPSLEAFRVWLRGASDGSEPGEFAWVVVEIAASAGVDVRDVLREYMGVLSAMPGPA